MAEENKMLSAALRYAGMGLAVFPLGFKKKTPATPDGFKSATKDRAQIEKWWSGSPGDKNNIGIATGGISGGLVVIDVDKLESFSEWLDRNGAFPRTATAVTGSGGMHFLFKSDKPEKSRIGLYPGIDVRAEGGYIVAPPSIHPNGNIYKWNEDPIIYGIAEVNEVVSAFLHPLEDLTRKYFEIGSEIIEGERNHTLFKAACSLRDKGFNEQAIYSAIMAENQCKCIPPLDDKEITTLVKSALKYEPEHRYTTTENGIIKPVKKKVITDLSMKTVADIEVKQVDWLVDGYVPLYQLITFGGDGGSAKTTLWSSILAAISSGRPTPFEELNAGLPYIDEPRKVMFFSSEDPVAEVLKPKIIKHGGNMENIFFMDLTDERFPELKFGSELLENLIKEHKPAVVVFDPIQSFIDEKIQMGSRNAMRQCLNPLVGLCNKYKVTIFLIAHANKSTGTWGRKRLADSADLWDISRAVFLNGKLKNGLFYTSQEKNNYAPLAKTLLFDLEGGKLNPKGFTTKHDKDFIQEEQYMIKQAPAREEAKAFILETLQEQGGKIETAELTEWAEAMSISESTLKRAKSELKKEGKIEFAQPGKGEDKKFYVSLKESGLA